MSTEQKDLEQNALASGLANAWTNFKQGKLISYKLMALILIVIAGLFLWWYIASEKKKGTSQRWMVFDEASSVDQLKSLAEKDPNTSAGRVAELLIARVQLGPEGLDQLAVAKPEARQKALESIEKARESFGKLLDQFKNDPVFKAECLLGLAKAEAALIAVPEKSDKPTGNAPAAPSTEFKGKLSKLVEYLDQLAAAAAPGSPWATDSKKMADTLRDEKSVSATEFVTIQRALFRLEPTPLLGKDSPFSGGPHSPGLPPPDFTVGK